MYSDSKNKAYSGQGNLGSSLAAFAVMFVLFLGSLYSLSFWTLENGWLPGLACLVLATAAFLIPQGIMGRSEIKVEEQEQR
ncbi:hypothetical protein GCM10008096_22970 [Zhihengliuella salsuginis]|uniref:Uncharacterized protein n=1 Tax=Zhihengliuella salsuginis TaxID=578222 RepID=A0ABQ3GKX4_9MICC|nr:hypothetical protein GCM10008096_22970 [Zhihengliuella salsuginis]